MRICKANFFGLLVLALIACPSQAQPDTLIDRIGASDNSGVFEARPTKKTTGYNCYHGICDDDEDGHPVAGMQTATQDDCEDCSKKVSTTACYGCCSSNGCDGNNDAGWCQDYCDGNASPWSGWGDLTHNEQELKMWAAEFTVDEITHAFDDGHRLTGTDVIFLDGALARFIDRGDIYNARRTLAIMLESFALDRIDSEDPFHTEDIIGEIHQMMLFDTNIPGLRSTARAIGANHGVLGTHDRYETMMDLFKQYTAENGEDPHVLRILTH